MGLLMGKFHQFLTEVSARDSSVFSFPDNNFSKYQQIFTKLGFCIDIVEICFGIAVRRSFYNFLQNYLLATHQYLSFRTIA